MHKLKYSISFGVMMLVFCGAYYVSYQYSLNEFQAPQLAEEEIKVAPEEPALTVDTTEQQTISNKTAYVLESYNTNDFTVEEETLSMPAELIGMTREELIEYLQVYEESPSVEDIENGFISFELVSFAEGSITLRKTFSPPEIEYKYFLTAEDNYVIVYYVDKETVYEYTDIPLSILPETLRDEIMEGKFITDSEELFNFLENYSS